MFEFTPKDRARTERDPILTGKGNIGGEIKEISLFKSESKDGSKKYFTGYVKEPWEPGQQAAESSQAADTPF